MRNFSGSSDQTALSGKGYTIAPDGYLRSHGVPSVRQAGVPETPTLAEQAASLYTIERGGHLRPKTRFDTFKEVIRLADKYDQALLKAQDGKVLDNNEQHAFSQLCKEHGTDRGNAARKLRDGK